MNNARLDLNSLSFAMLLSSVPVCHCPFVDTAGWYEHTATMQLSADNHRLITTFAKYHRAEAR